MATEEITARRSSTVSTEAKGIRLHPSRASAAVALPSPQPTRHAEATTAVGKVYAQASERAAGLNHTVLVFADMQNARIIRS